MNNSLAEDIKEILYEHGAVVIPGLGAFKGSVKASAIDGVQGLIEPPSLDLQFDSNAVVNDGILLDFVIKKHQITSQDAESVIKAFAKDALDAFAKHELVVIPEVGRLYKDFTNQIRFLPDNTNFNTESFGLPKVQFYPVSRYKNTEQTAQTTVSGAATEPTVKEPIYEQPKPVLQPKLESTEPPIPFLTRITAMLPSDWSLWLPGVTIGILALLVLSIFIWTNRKPAPVVRQPRQAVQNPVKQAPPAQQVENSPITAPPSVTPQQNTKQNNTTIASEKYVETKTENNNSSDISQSFVGKKKRAVIIVGGFENSNNILRLEDWIENNGFKVYERHRNGLTVVGAEFSYKSDEELKAIYNRFYKRYGNGIELRKY